VNEQAFLDFVSHLVNTPPPSDWHRKAVPTSNLPSQKKKKEKTFATPEKQKTTTPLPSSSHLLPRPKKKHIVVSQ
jgi:hypothetical protein